MQLSLTYLPKRDNKTLSDPAEHFLTCLLHAMQNPFFLEILMWVYEF